MGVQKLEVPPDYHTPPEEQIVKAYIRRSLLVLLALVLAVASATFWLMPAQATSLTQYEYFNTNDDTAVAIWGVNWSSETFTITPEAHSVAQVLLRLYRIGTPGTVTLSIRETNGGGLPTGPDLASATLNGDTLTTSTSGVMYAFDFDPAPSLEYDEVYSLVLRNPTGTSGSVCIMWRMDGSAGSYSGGSECLSTNSGTSWTADTDDDYHFEIWGDPLFSISSAQVFRGYLEDDDMLFVFPYLNTYVPYYPNDDSNTYFDLQLRNITGATILAQNPCPAWGYKPGAIYLNADAAAGLTPSSAFRIYLYGDFGSFPNKYYTLQSSDWRGDDLTFLDQWALSLAHDMADYYNTDLTTFAGNEEVLNDEGGTVFKIGIPALAEVRPSLFQSATQKPGVPSGEESHAFEEATSWEAQVGPQVVAFFTWGGGKIGTDGKTFGAILLVSLYLLVIIWLVFGADVDAAWAAIVCVPFLPLMAWLRLINIAIVAVIGSVSVLLLLKRFWWDKT
jgi:hypothetical protein